MNLDAFRSYISHSVLSGMSVRTNPGRSIVFSLCYHVALWPVEAQGRVLLVTRQKRGLRCVS